jgi:hypothetical protein
LTQIGVAFLTLALVLPAAVQSGWQPGHTGLGFGQPAGKQSVEMVSPKNVALAEKQHVLALRFSVDPGLHINSHDPHSSFLIPTSLTFASTPGVTVGSVDYPPGKEFHLPVAPQEALNVYTGDFSLLAHVTARPGVHKLQGTLHYQACDNRACNPPRSLPITLTLHAQ